MVLVFEVTVVKVINCGDISCNNYDNVSAIVLNTVTMTVMVLILVMLEVVVSE